MCIGDWKLIAENFVDFYHIDAVHPELSRLRAAQHSQAATFSRKPSCRFSRVDDHLPYQGFIWGRNQLRFLLILILYTSRFKLFGTQQSVKQHSLPRAVGDGQYVGFVTSPLTDCGGPGEHASELSSKKRN